MPGSWTALLVALVVVGGLLALFLHLTWVHGAPGGTDTERYARRGRRQGHDEGGRLERGRRELRG